MYGDPFSGHVGVSAGVFVGMCVCVCLCFGVGKWRRHTFTVNNLVIRVSTCGPCCMLLLLSLHFNMGSYFLYTIARLQKFGDKNHSPIPIHTNMAANLYAYMIVQVCTSVPVYGGTNSTSMSIYWQNFTSTRLCGKAKYSMSSIHVQSSTFTQEVKFVDRKTNTPTINYNFPCNSARYKTK